MAALPYAELISALAELEALAIVRRAALEFEDEKTGRKVSLFFVDVATARHSARGSPRNSTRACG